ncbi:MAG: PilZ domain-containing protein [bacterium]|nr:PilZ domain-containing protein [bacterium]
MKMEGYPNLERRRFSRLKDNIFIFGNLRLNPIEEFKVFTSDISAGGLMFDTEKDIPQDVRLDFEIYQSRDRRKSMIFSIPVSAKIVWKREIEKENFEQGENRYRIGIEFLELKEEDRERIAKYVEEGI